MIPQLIRDDPTWTYRVGPQTVQRRLRVWRTDSTYLTVVVTEDGPGMSITNAAPEIAVQLHREYPGDVLTVIEHYPPNVGADPTEHYDQVGAWPGAKSVWRRLDTTDLEHQLPGLRQTSGATPMPLWDNDTEEA